MNINDEIMFFYNSCRYKPLLGCLQTWWWFGTHSGAHSTLSIRYRGFSTDSNLRDVNKKFEVYFSLNIPVISLEGCQVKERFRDRRESELWRTDQNFGVVSKTHFLSKARNRQEEKARNRQEEKYPNQWRIVYWTDTCSHYNTNKSKQRSEWATTIKFIITDKISDFQVLIIFKSLTFLYRVIHK